MRALYFSARRAGAESAQSGLAREGGRDLSDQKVTVSFSLHRSTHRRFPFCHWRHHSFQHHCARQIDSNQSSNRLQNDGFVEEISDSPQDQASRRTRWQLLWSVGRICYACCCLPSRSLGLSFYRIARRRIARKDSTQQLSCLIDR